MFGFLKNLFTKHDKREPQAPAQSKAETAPVKEKCGIHPETRAFGGNHNGNYTAQKFFKGVRCPGESNT
jgi:hypothetical protein